MLGRAAGSPVPSPFRCCPLARMEAEVAFEQLLLQRPAPALAQRVELPAGRKPINVRGLETLPLRNAACPP
jgi:cytochrome P450